MELLGFHLSCLNGRDEHGGGAYGGDASVLLSVKARVLLSQGDVMRAIECAHASHTIHPLTQRVFLEVPLSMGLYSSLYLEYETLSGALSSGADDTLDVPCIRSRGDAAQD